MITVIASIIFAVFFVFAITMLHHVFVKNVNGEEAVISRVALGACLAVCMAVIGVAPLL